MAQIATLPPDFADNERHTLRDVLADAVLHWGQDRLWIASGYFSPKVWPLVREAFPRLAELRLLLGAEPALEQGGSATLDLRTYFRAKIAGDLDGLQFNREQAALVDDLIAYLRRDEVALRLFSGAFLHAKAYIFPKIAIAGSSNFTPAGLTSNAELNLVHKSEGVAAQLREWYAGKWAQAEDYKATLIDLLDASKFGRKPYTPFDVFIKALYEYFRERIAPETAEGGGVELASFQEEGKREAIRLLERHHSVLIADAVGLGKTYIALALLEHELRRRRKGGRPARALVVCPAQLRDGVWRPALEREGIMATVLSQEEIGREDFDWKRWGRIDVLVVDESHNFRNPATNRYRNLQRLIVSGRPSKRVVLLTATPINNSIWDLYHQVLLMARGNDAYYRDFGIGNLKGFFGRVAKGGAELFDLLEETTVRRSRLDIKRRQRDGERIAVAGREVRFPERRLHALEYDLDATLPGWYQEIDALIEQLGLVSYNIEQFRRRGAEERTVRFNRARIWLIKTVLLKRLESSAAAFEVSIRRQAAFQKRFLALLQEGRLLDAGAYRRLISAEEEEERPEAVENVLAALPVVDASAYDLPAIAQQVEADVATLQGILDWLDLVREPAAIAGKRPLRQDDKLLRLKQALAGPVLRGRKVLLFTSFQDTAEYLATMLRADAAWQAEAENPRIGLITGAVPAAERQRRVRLFAPRANRTADELDDLAWQPPEEQIQVLICTDVLSEGQNLQDAGAIINYDLHWNPVRMIQRAGRIDRIGSEHDPVHIFNVFPDEGLNELLGLVGKLTEKIVQIDTAIGLDASVLGEVVSERSLEEIRRLRRGDPSILDELEREGELASTEEMKFPLLRFIFEAGEGEVREIPLGIHSARRSGTPGIFFAFRARDRSFWRFYPLDGGEPVTDVPRIYRQIACDRVEPRTAAEIDIFPWLERATADILTQLRQERGARRIPPALTGIARRLFDALSVPGLFDQVDEEQRARLLRVVRQASLRPFERDRALRGIITAYESTRDVAAFHGALEAFFLENGLLETGDERQRAQEIRAEDLQLVCYEMLT